MKHQYSLETAPRLTTHVSSRFPKYWLLHVLQGLRKSTNKESMKQAIHCTWFTDAEWKNRINKPHFCFGDKWTSRVAMEFVPLKCCGNPKMLNQMGQMYLPSIPDVQTWGANELPYRDPLVSGCCRRWVAVNSSNVYCPVSSEGYLEKGFATLRQDVVNRELLHEEKKAFFGIWRAPGLTQE